MIPTASGRVSLHGAPAYSNATGVFYSACCLGDDAWKPHTHNTKIFFIYHEEWMQLLLDELHSKWWVIYQGLPITALLLHEWCDTYPFSFAVGFCQWKWGEWGESSEPWTCFWLSLKAWNWSSGRKVAIACLFCLFLLLLVAIACFRMLPIHPPYTQIFIIFSNVCGLQDDSSWWCAVWWKIARGLPAWLSSCTCIWSDLRTLVHIAQDCIHREAVAIQGFRIS